MAFRRGFKAEANKYANDFREELGKRPHEPLCPWALADLLAIPVLTLGAFRNEETEAVSTLLNSAQDEFSAVSIFVGRKRLVVHNEAHHPFRQSANIAHELSHAILMHPPTPPFNDNGERNYCSEVKVFEEEANWLGPALLISEQAALHIIKNRIPMPEACHIYNASEPLINMRLNVTGARKRAARQKRY